MKNLRKDIPNERRNNVIAVIICLFLIVLATKCTSQTIELSRSANYNTDLNRETTRIYPKDALVFRSPMDEKDTIYLSILADSIQPNAYSIKLYAFFPKSVNTKKSKYVTITFTDNTSGVFRMCLNEEQSYYNYMEYNMNTNFYHKLKTLKVKNIEFESIYKYKIYEDDMFMAFLNSYAVR